MPKHIIAYVVPASVLLLLSFSHLGLQNRKDIIFTLALESWNSSFPFWAQNDNKHHVEKDLA